MDTEVDSGIKRAVRNAQGLTALGKKLGVSKAVIWNWVDRGIVPADRCPDVERATGVRCEELNPGVDWAVLRRPAAKAKAAA